MKAESGRNTVLATVDSGNLTYLIFIRTFFVCFVEDFLIFNILETLITPDKN